MKEKIKDLLTQSIQLEMHVADIYEIFANAFPDDKNFWWELVLEEKNHAAILRAGENSYFDTDFFPVEMLADSLEQLQSVNRNLEKLIRSFEDHLPTKETAFNIAYKLEESAGEIHFQEYMDKEAKTEMDRIFKRLNQDDKDHSERILSRMERDEIKINTDLLPDFLQ